MRTYNCGCGYRWVGADDAGIQPCPTCGEQVDAPARLPNPMRVKMADILCDFFRKVDPDGLAQQIADGQSVAGKMLETMPKTQLWMARGYLGREGLDYMQSADDGEMDAILDVMLDSGGDAPLILWANRDWSLREMRRVRDVMLST